MAEYALAEVLASVEEQGSSALEALGPGPFLVELPTPDPAGRVSEAAPSGGGASVMTVSYNEQLLLSLRRTRSASGARLFSLERGATVGRSSDCLVTLKGEDSVTRAHARFDQTAGLWEVIDLGSTNGTFVEHERIPERGRKALAEDVMWLQIGGHRFAFANRDGLDALLAPIAEPRPISVSQLLTELETLGSRRFLLRHSHPSLLIGLARGKPPREVLPLVGQAELRIGRTEDAEITIAKDSVSARHAKLRPRGDDRWELLDTGSSNGTQVNGAKLGKNQPHRLGSWDAINFGPAAWALFLQPQDLLERLQEEAS